MRVDDPHGVSFIEQHIIWEAEEKMKVYKQSQRKSKSRKGRR